jgi:hypothetical protein
MALKNLWHPLVMPSTATPDTPLTYPPSDLTHPFYLGLTMTQLHSPQTIMLSHLQPPHHHLCTACLHLLLQMRTVAGQPINLQVTCIMIPCSPRFLYIAPA